MSADRELFNRRELRRSLGTRASRRAGTKHPRAFRTKDGRITHVTTTRPKARLSEKIASTKENQS